MRCAHTVDWLSRSHDVLVVTSKVSRRGVPGDPGVRRVLPRVSPTPLGSLSAPLAALRAARAIRPILTSFHPDLVFVWNFGDIPHAAIRIAEHVDSAVAYSVSDMNFDMLHVHDQFLRHLTPGERGPRGVWARVARIVNRHPALCLETKSQTPASIVWNSAAMQRMHRVSPALAPVLERVIYPAIGDPDLFTRIKRAPEGTPTILYVGRLEWVKAPDTAYRALAVLRDRHGIDARLVLAGEVDPAMLRTLNKLAGTLAVTNRVEVLGQRPRADVARLLAGAHALVVPSRWPEPFGMVCLEAALARVPVVASLSGGMPEMLEPEEEALFFPIDDAEACAAALARTLTDTDTAAERVRRAYARAGTYSLERYRADFDAFVEAALAASSEVVPDAP
jgi:glycosyltransferase involved in cell wall biosynthesis